MFKKLIDNSAAKSPWLFHINAGSCNGCDIELVAVLTPRYDAERLGFKLAGTPRHADIVVVSGPITAQSKDRVHKDDRAGARPEGHCHTGKLSQVLQRVQGQLFGGRSAG